MKRAFLDTNILLDYVLGRERGDDAEQLLQYGQNGEVSLLASYLCGQIRTNYGNSFPNKSQRSVIKT